MTAVRVGLVGLGRLAEVGYLPALRSLPGAELVAVADLDENRCVALAPGIRAFPDATALVDEADVELVVVATPPSAHLDVARAAARAGVATLVEKPPASSLADAESLARLSPRPWLGLNRRFDPDVGALRKRVAGFEPPFELGLEMSIDRDRWGASTDAPTALLDLGPHLVDLALWLAGCEARATRAARIDDVTACFEIALDCGHARITGSHDSGWRESLSIRDCRGARAKVTHGGLARRAASRLQRGRRSPLVASLAAQLAAVCSALRSHSVDSRLATADDGVVIMAILEAADESARRSGAWLELTPARTGSCSR